MTARRRSSTSASSSFVAVSRRQHAQADDSADDAGDDRRKVATCRPSSVSSEAVATAFDIFSLARSCYEMLSGRRAFGPRPPIETMNSILHDDPPTCQAKGSRIPQSLERIVAMV